jgi:hypothetical protein
MDFIAVNMRKNRSAGEQIFKTFVTIDCGGEVAERRPIIAHGETVGSIVEKEIQAPAGAAENRRMALLSPLPGLDWLLVFTHG